MFVLSQSGPERATLRARTQLPAPCERGYTKQRLNTNTSNCGDAKCVGKLADTSEHGVTDTELRATKQTKQMARVSGESARRRDLKRRCARSVIPNHDLNTQQLFPTCKYLIITAVMMMIIIIKVDGLTFSGGSLSPAGGKEDTAVMGE